jgi:aconitate hydratase
MVLYTIERDGFIDVFDKMGATVLQMLVDHASECNGIVKAQTRKNAIQSYILFNRNFSKELTGTLIHLAFVEFP